MKIKEWIVSELGQDIWNKKYQFENETFEEWIERVSGGNKVVGKLIREKKFLFGGRILANRGLNQKGKKVTYSNCYVLPKINDSIESIFDTAKQLARTFSYGGGVGVDISKLAPRGAKLNNAAKETTGAVSFMDLYSLVTGLISQNGRRGALMLSIDCNHPDLEEFIQLKTDLNKVTKANISINITDEFMNAVKNNGNFELTFTREATGETTSNVVDARKIFRMIAECNWDYAEPGFLLKNRIDSWSLVGNDESFEYAGVNPCVSGDTTVLTSTGYKEIKSLVNQEVDIWNGYEFSRVIPKITGYNQPMLKITFSDGSEIKCTEYHKFILPNRDKIPAKKLRVNEELARWTYPVISSGQEVDRKIAYTQGFFMGDGSIETQRKRLSIKLYGNKRKLDNSLIYKHKVYCPSSNCDFLTLPHKQFLYNKHFVPSTQYSIKSRLDWLAGYIDSDGNLNSPYGSIQISSINKDVLMQVKDLINTLGCSSSVSIMREGGEKYLPLNDGTCAKALYKCQTCYRLIINVYNVQKLISLGLKTNRVPLIAKPSRDASRFIRVVNIEKIDNEKVVYCFNEPKNHSAVFNGILTGQCAEQPLPAYGSCLLGSINLNEFVDNPFSETATFKWNEFEETVSSVVIAMNEVLDEGLALHPLAEQRNCAFDWRQIGVGIMGLADMLIKLRIKYGSKKSLELCDKIGFVFIDTAIRQSALLAKEQGTYPKYNKEAILSSPFLLANVSDETLQLVKQYGLRNSQLLTTAPTGSLSTMLGISGGIEPIYNYGYKRKTESLHNKDVYYTVYTPIVGEYVEKFNLASEADLPNFFTNAMELHYEDRILMQSVWQKHIDASISSTVNVPNNFTLEQVEDLYIKAWEHGLKGITIYRDGCKREGILQSLNDTKKDNYDFDSIIPVPRSQLGTTYGVTDKYETACGSLYLTINRDKDGNMVETFVHTSKNGTCKSNIDGLNRMISLCLRSGTKIDEIIDQLKSITCTACTRMKAKGSKQLSGVSCPDIISRALESEYRKDDKDNQIGDSLKSDTAAVCAECNTQLNFSEGCSTCPNCGHSKCA